MNGDYATYTSSNVCEQKQAKRKAIMILNRSGYILFVNIQHGLDFFKSRFVWTKKSITRVFKNLSDSIGGHIEDAVRNNRDQNQRKKDSKLHFLMKKFLMREFSPA